METIENKPVVLPVATIRLQLGDKAIGFNPADDITGKEVALIMQMFLNGVFSDHAAMIDFGSYINHHNLGRHFSEIKEEKAA